MGLESATYISQLDDTFPLGGDPTSQGDDHIRLVKSVLQSQFPNLTALAVNPSSVEFNLLVGLLATAAELNILDGALLSTAELNTLNGILSSTAELNRLQSYVASNNRALESDGSGNIIVSAVTTAELSTLDGILSTTAELNRLQSFIGNINRAIITDGSGNIITSAVTATELSLLDGLLASTAELNILNGILSSTAELNRLQSFVGTVNRALESDGSGNIIVSSITSAELAFLNNVSSNIQTQLDGKAPNAHSHTGSEISALDAADTTTGIFVAARIPTHTNQVVGQTSLALANAAITGQTDIGAAIVAADEILISDGGNIRRSAISRLTTFFNAGLVLQGGSQSLQTEQLTTSGTSKTFSGIPSWVTKITVIFEGVSSSTTNDFRFRLGDSVSVEATGYISEIKKLVSATLIDNTETTFFEVVFVPAVARFYNGHLELAKISGNTWIASWLLSDNSQSTIWGAGSKTLSGTLDRVEFSISSGAFDAGAINISWS